MKQKLGTKIIATVGVAAVALGSAKLLLSTSNYDVASHRSWENQPRSPSSTVLNRAIHGNAMKNVRVQATDSYSNTDARYYLPPLNVCDCAAPGGSGAYNSPTCGSAWRHVDGGMPDNSGGGSNETHDPGEGHGPNGDTGADAGAPGGNDTGSDTGSDNGSDSSGSDNGGDSGDSGEGGGGGGGD